MAELIVRFGDGSALMFDYDEKVMEEFALSVMERQDAENIPYLSIPVERI
jgi:hypothetical protein